MLADTVLYVLVQALFLFEKNLVVRKRIIEGGAAMEADDQVLLFQKVKIPADGELRHIEQLAGFCDTQRLICADVIQQLMLAVLNNRS